MKRFILILIVVLLVAVVVVVAGGLLLFNDIRLGPHPAQAGEISVQAAEGIPGLNDRVEIIRDEWGVPHIYASNPYDLFFAQGYTHAQDRWWQMEWYRHQASGRIQELTGRTDSVMGIDIALRTMGWRHVAQAEYDSIYTDEAKAVLQAFADGVNAYILNRPADDLAIEYSLLGLTGVSIDIEPWTPVDTLVWAKAMAWNLANDGSEMLRSEMIDALGEDMTADLFPDWPHGEKPTMIWDEDLPITDATLTTRDTAASAGITGLTASFAGNFDDQTGIGMAKGPDIGSNNWTVSGALTESGMPLLANDMHLGLGMPSIWYEVGLHCQPVTDECPYEVVGFQFSPAPMVTAGHNAHIAWGHTDHTDDIIDYYLIRVNPENDLQYEWNGEWRDMTTREEVIRFGDSDETLTIEVRETHLGPIVNDHQIDAEGNIGGFNNADPRAMRWTALEPGTIMQAIFMLNQATNWEEFREALRYWDAPSQNIVYADVEGNIGMQNPGRIPIRAEGHDGTLPVPGWTDAYEWLGYIPFDNLPRVLNPERGYVATANQATVPLAYFEQLRDQLSDEYGEDANYTYSRQWAIGYRGQRIDEMLQALAPHSAETFRTIYGDNKLISAEEILPAVAALTFDDDALTDARDWLLDWDYQMHMDSPQAALYAYFWASLANNLFDDQLNTIERSASGSDQYMWVTYLLLDEPENEWWDDITTTDTSETRDDILRRSFEQAHARAVEELGEDREAWRWGQLHTITFISNPLGISGISQIEDIVNRGPVAISGGSAIVNATGWNVANGDFTSSGGPSERVVYDTSDWSRSLSMHTTGQSGHPYHPNYDDQIDPWRFIELKPMLWTREQVDAAAVNRLVLQPAGE